MAVITYIFQHFLAVMLLDKRLRLFFPIISFFLVLVIFSAKVDTYDIYSYVNSVGYSYVYEPLYALIIRIFSYFEPNHRLVIFYFQSLLTVLFLSLAYVFPKKRLLLFSIILLSVFFQLSVNNALRQGMASVFILYSIAHLLKSRFFIFLVFSSLAYLTHFSSLFFSFIIVALYFFIRSLYIKISFGLLQIFLVIAGLASALVLTGFVEFSGYGHYVGMSLTQNNERTPLNLKVLVIFVVFMASEVLLSFRKLEHDLDFVRFLRTYFMFFLMFLALSESMDEIGGRILFFYFSIEMLLMLMLVNIGKYKPVVLILVSYGFAFNVWNILGGI